MFHFKGSPNFFILKHLPIYVLYLQTESVTLTEHILSEWEVRFKKESCIIQFKSMGILMTMIREMLKQHKTHKEVT
jgi:hypothetical protein